MASDVKESLVSSCLGVSFGFRWENGGSNFWDDEFPRFEICSIQKEKKKKKSWIRFHPKRKKKKNVGTVC